MQTKTYQNKLCICINIHKHVLMKKVDLFYTSISAALNFADLLQNSGFSVAP